ncbi:MAG: hypothetical protein ABIC40_03520 [bacterium]
MAFEIPAAEPLPEELAHECAEASDNAVEWVRSMSGMELDFSPPSLIGLDRILKELIPSLSSEDQEPTVILLGSYLGEVVLRACGGRWETGDVFAGPGIRGLFGKEITISPFVRIRQAFSNLEEFHLSRFWNAMVERVRNANPLDDPAGFSKPPGNPLRMLPVSGIIGQTVAKGPSDEELAKIIEEETQKFISILKKDLGVELDYSLNSLRFLDLYFRSLSDAIKSEGKMGERRVFVYLAGNYLGEVVRQVFGGKWVYLAEQQTSGLVVNMGKSNRTVYPHQAAGKLATEYSPGAVVNYVESIKKGLELEQRVDDR